MAMLGPMWGLMALWLGFVAVSGVCSYTRWQKNAGVLLIIGGYASLVLYGVYEFLRAGSIPPFPKIGGLAVLIGFAALLASAVRERIWTYKSDRYKEVRR